MCVTKRESLLTQYHVSSLVLTNKIRFSRVAVFLYLDIFTLNWGTGDKRRGTTWFISSNNATKSVKWLSSTLSEDDRKQNKTALRQIRVICSAMFKKITLFISGVLLRIELKARYFKHSDTCIKSILHPVILHSKLSRWSPEWLRVFPVCTAGIKLLIKEEVAVRALWKFSQSRLSYSVVIRLSFPTISNILEWFWFITTSLMFSTSVNYSFEILLQ